MALFVRIEMEQITEFTMNFLDGSINENEIKTFVKKLKNNELDGELNELKELIESQLSYVHPFKLKKQAEFHELGCHNQKVLDALNKLKECDDTGQALKEFKDIFAEAA